MAPSLPPRAPASALEDPWENYKAYRCPKDVLFRGEAGARIESSHVFQDRAGTPQKNALYRCFDIHIYVFIQTKSLRTKAKDGERGLFPKLNQKYKNSRGSVARVWYLR